MSRYHQHDCKYRLSSDSVSSDSPQALSVAGLSLLSGLVSSVPLPDGVGLVGHGGHGGHGGYHQESYQPDPFHFTYGVHDDYHHTDFSESRSGDEGGNIKVNLMI